MKLRNQSKFHICGLNQEKVLNELTKKVHLSEIDRQDKSNTTFVCSFFDYKKVEKLLKNRNIKIQSIKHEGVAYKLKSMLLNYGLILATVVFLALYLIQNQFVFQFEVQGLDKLSKTEVVSYINQNFSKHKASIDTKAVEIGLMENFDCISFASCMIKGQTLVINIKEKLLPEEMYGTFSPITAKSDGKVTKIDLISGTLCVKVGDIVRKGDVLVKPYTIDTSGNIKKVEAKAEITADVYYEGSVDHFESFVEVKRTGRVAVQNQITLFGLKIYSFKENMDFKMYETECEDVDLTSNLLLPFKMQKIKYYELSENLIETTFEEVKEEYIEKAKKKALENCENYDKIKDEFFSLRHLSGVTIVNYCIVTEEEIGVHV